MTLTAASLVQHDAERDEWDIAVFAVGGFVKALTPLSPRGRRCAITAALQWFIRSVPDGQRDLVMGNVAKFVLRQVASAGEQR